MRRRGRLLGPVAQRVLEYAQAMGSVTALDVAHGLQLSRGHAARTLYNLRVAGHLVAAGEILQPPARRPVIVCAPAVSPVQPLALERWLRRGG